MDSHNQCRANGTDMTAGSKTIYKKKNGYASS